MPNDLNEQKGEQKHQEESNEHKIRRSYLEVLDSMKKIVGKENMSDFLFNCEVESFLKFLNEEGQGNEELKKFFKEKYEEFSRDVEGFKELFESYRLDSLFAENLINFIDEFGKRNQEVEEQEEYNRLLKEIKDSNSNELKIKLDPNIQKCDEVKGNYKIKRREKGNFERNGVKYEFSAEEIDTKEFGKKIILDRIKIDGIEIKIINVDVLSRGIRNLRYISNEYERLNSVINFSKEQKENLIFSTLTNSFLLPKNIDQSKLKEKERTYEREKSGEIIYYSPNGRKLYEIREDGEMQIFRNFNKDGELIPTYKEFLSQTEDKIHVLSNYMKMLATALDGIEDLDRFLSTMFIYVKEEFNESTITTFPSLRENVFKDDFKDWGRILKEENPQGQLTGDCDNYAVFAKEILRLKGIEAQVLLIPNHATTVWVEKKEGKYVLNDIGNFNWQSYEGQSLDDCLIKLFDRYEEAVEQKIILDRNMISVLNVENFGNGKQHAQISLLSIEALEDQEMAKDFFYFQEQLHKVLFQSKLESIKERNDLIVVLGENSKTEKLGISKEERAYLLQEFSKLKEKYGNLRDDKTNKSKFPLLSLFEAFLSEDENNIYQLVQNYINNQESCTHESLSLLLYKMPEEFRVPKFIRPIIERMFTLEEVHFSADFGAIACASAREYNSPEIIFLLKKLGDEKMNDKQKLLLYRNLFHEVVEHDLGKGQIYARILVNDLAEFIFNHEDPESIKAIEYFGYKNFKTFFAQIPTEKQINYSLKALKKDPENQFYQISILDGLMRQKKFEVVDYLFIQSEVFANMLKNLDNLDAKIREQIIVMRMRNFENLGKKNELKEFIKQVLISKVYVSDDIIYKFLEKNKIAGRELFNEVFEEQLKEREEYNKKAMIPETEKKAAELENIPVMNIKFCLRQDDFKSLKSVSEKFLASSSVYAWEKMDFIFYVGAFLRSNKEKLKVQSQNETFRNFIQYLKDYIEILIKHPAIQIREIGGWMSAVSVLQNQEWNFLHSVLKGNVENI